MLSCILSWRSYNLKVIRKNWPTSKCNTNLILRFFWTMKGNVLSFYFRHLSSSCAERKKNHSFKNLTTISGIYWQEYEIKFWKLKRRWSKVYFSQLLLVSSFILKSYSFLRHEFSFNSIILYSFPVISIDFYHKYYLYPLRSYKVVSLRCLQCLGWSKINFKQAEKYFKQVPYCEQSLRRQGEKGN